MRKQEIEDFLAEKKAGFAGISRTKAKSSNAIYQKLKETGWEVFPIHPVMDYINGDKCVRSVHELPKDVYALMVIASPKVTANVLADTVGTGIRRVWVFTKRDHPEVKEVIKRLEESGVSVISGICPLLFLEPVTSVHAFHRFFVRLFGRYPGD